MEPSGPSKNDPKGQRTRSGPESRRNGRFYVRPKSGFWPKNGSYPKKSPKMTFSPLIIWAKATFFFEQLFPVVVRTWLGSRSVFFWPKISSPFSCQFVILAAFFKQCQTQQAKSKISFWLEGRVLGSSWMSSQDPTTISRISKIFLTLTSNSCDTQN